MGKRKLFWSITIVLLLAIGILARISLQCVTETYKQTNVLKQEPVLPIPDLKPDKVTIIRTILALTTRLPFDHEKFKTRLMLLQSVRKQNLPENEILESLQLMADRYEIMYKNENDRFSNSLLQQLGILHCFLGNSERGLKFLKESIDKALLRDQNYHPMFLVHDLVDYNLIDEARELFLLRPKEEQDREPYLKSRLLGEPLPPLPSTDTEKMPIPCLEETFATMPPLIEMKGYYLRQNVFSQLKEIIQKDQLDLADHIVEKLQAEEYWRFFSTEMSESEWEDYMEQMLVLARLDYLRGRKNRFDEKRQKLESQLDLWIKAENTRYDKMTQNWPRDIPQPYFERRYLELPFALKLEYIQISIDTTHLDVSIQALKELKLPSSVNLRNKYASCFRVIYDALIQKKDYARIHELIEDIYQEKYDRQRQNFFVYKELLTAGESADAEQWADQSQIPQPRRKEIDIAHAIRKKDFEKAIKEIGQLNEPGTQINFLFELLNQ